MLLHLFYDGKNKSHKSFCGVYGFLFSYESGKTLTVSHIFVFCPAGSNGMTAFELATIIIKRDVREHNINSFRLHKAQGVPLLPADLLMNCPFIEYIISQQILQNQ